MAHKISTAKTHPRLNINGTSADELLLLRQDAIISLEVAKQSLLKMMPHGRDYQTCEPEWHKEAVCVHEERVQSIINVMVEINGEVEAILKQQQERR